MLISHDKIVAKYGKPRGILHIGANTGQEAQDYNKHDPEAVVWVEALDHVYEKLYDNVSRYVNHVAIKSCVSDEDGKVIVFHESNNEGQSSSMLQLGTHKKAHPEVHYIADHRMETIRIDTMLSRLPKPLVSCLDFLAMDIQGAELMALKGMGDYLNQFKFAYLEVNTDYVYEGCALLPEITKFLKGFGFKPAEEKIFNQWAWGDKLYIK